MTVPAQLLPKQWLLPKLLPRERVADQVRVFIAALDPEKPYRVTIDVAKPPRSNDQNEALWGLAYKVLEKETGNDPDDLHIYFCGEFFGWVDHEIMGMRRRRPRRTTTTDDRGKRDVISKSEFCDFYAFIQRRSAETVGVFIPDPDPNYSRVRE